MVEIQTIDYALITCPKCDKKHFKKIHKPSLSLVDLFTIEPDLIYKDGILQNPPKQRPIEESFKCLECDCNFRIEYFSKENFKIIDIDLELEKIKEEQQKRFEENKKYIKENIASIQTSIEDVNKFAVCTDNNTQTQLTISDTIIKRDEFETKFTELERQIINIQKQVDQLKTDILFK